MTDGDLELVRDSVRRFAKRELAPLCDTLNHYPDEPLPAKMLPGLSELGLLELGEDPVILCEVLQCLSRVSAAPAAIVLTNAFARALLVELGRKNGSGPQPGSIGAFPIYDEPDESSYALTLREQDGAFVLSGKQAMVSLAPVADYLLLPVHDAAGALPALVLLEQGTPGVEVGESLLTLGMRGCPVADVECDLVAIGADRVVARGGAASAAIRNVTERFFGPVVALITANVEASLANAADYARQRYQGGKNIVDHQQVRAMLAEMLADLGTCRGAQRALCCTGRAPPVAASLFVRAKEVATRATTDGVQLLGGNGYMEDYGQERCMRDARQAACLLGRPDYWRQEVIADWLADAAETPALSPEELS